MRNIHDLSQFQRFLVLLAARAGQLFNLAEIGKECGISQTTAKDWLMLLQATSILYLLEPYSRNMTKRVVKSPKLLFVDTGLLCYLLRIESAQQLMHGPFAGHVFENMVIMDKIKQFAEQGKRPPCYFYRSAKGEEVDLIIDHGAHVDAYEIKYTMNPNAEMAIGLLNFRDEHPTSHAALLTLRKEPYPIRGDLQALHWSAPINV
jgi:predicted AAA+ superfamily ATPase